MNPFLETWTTPFESPPFDRIRPEHFKPAYAQALDRHRAEIASIASAKEAPSFGNTIVSTFQVGRVFNGTDARAHRARLLSAGRRTYE